MSAGCLFCKIANKEIPAKIIYEDDLVISFRDINPQAPTHVLTVPKKHITTPNDAEAEDQFLLGHMMLTGTKLAAELGIDESGYRLIMNCNKEGGQTVFHIHLHLMGGRQLMVLG